MFRAVVLFLTACTSTAPVVVTSLASAPKARATPAQPSGTLRVMSYNVNFGLSGDASGIAAIEQAHPQIVFLQETDDGWRDALVKGLPQYRHHHFAPPTTMPAG